VTTLLGVPAEPKEQMLYKVTGGKDGVSGVEVNGRRTEAGQTVELAASKATYLLEIGLLEPVNGKSEDEE